MKSEETIHIRQLSTGYPARRGVRVVSQGIDATLRSGELTCLLGANGVGKSTLLRTLSAFLPPVGGEIMLMGKRLQDYTDKQLATVIGVVLTEKCNLRNMTVEELVGMGRSPYTGFWGTLRKDDRRVVDEALALVRIEGLRQRMVHTLSDGERQKVMIAKALAQETPVIFLDEPTAFLDFPSKVEIMQLLHRLSREMGKTVFLSTHDLELALQIADCIWLMNREGGVVIGTPEDLSLDGNLSAFFPGRGISFDRHTGLFRIAHTCTAEVLLTGEGIYRDMAEKALRRNGVRAVSSSSANAALSSSSPADSASSALSIEATPEGFIIHPADGSTQEARTIGELLHLVLPIINRDNYKKT